MTEWAASYEEGRRLLGMGDAESALSQFDLSLQRHPEFLPARLGRFHSLLLLRDAPNVLAEARELIRTLRSRGDWQREGDIRQDVDETFPGLASLIGVGQERALPTPKPGF